MVHAFFTILGQNLTYIKICIIWQLSSHWLQWYKSQFHKTFLDQNTTPIHSLILVTDFYSVDGYAFLYYSCDESYEAGTCTTVISVERDFKWIVTFETKVKMAKFDKISCL